MRMPHERALSLVRGFALGSGLVTSVAGTTHIAAAMQDHELCTEVVESADGARHDKAALIYGLLRDDQQHGVATEYAYKLAIRDLRTAVPGGRLPGGPGGTRRPVAVVMCIKGRAEDDAATRRAADHLTERVGVSPIVTQSTRQALVTQRAIAESGASVLHVCESCGTELRTALKGIGDPSLVFQNAPSRAAFAPMILKKLPELEAHVRERSGFDGSARIRVVLLRPHNDDGWEVGRAIDDTLVINGSAATLQKGTNYLPVDYATARTGGGTDRHVTAAAAVAAFRPHIVLAIAGDREIVTLLDTVDRRLEPSAPRPICGGWTPHGGLVDFIGTNDERRTRVYSYAAGMPASQEQRERRNAAAADFAREFPGVAPVASVFFHYGAPYQIMYAAAAAGARRPDRLTATDLARGIVATQTPGARQVYVGRRDLPAGLADAATGPIALQNLHPAHPLNWSQNSYGVPMVDNGRVCCFTRNPSTGALVETSAGQVWEEGRTPSPAGLCRADRGDRRAAGRSFENWRQLEPHHPLAASTVRVRISSIRRRIQSNMRLQPTAASAIVSRRG
jgi:hypothetical protein